MLQTFLRVLRHFLRDGLIKKPEVIFWQLPNAVFGLFLISQNEKQKKKTEKENKKRDTYTQKHELQGICTRYAYRV